MKIVCPEKIKTAIIKILSAIRPKQNWNLRVVLCVFSFPSICFFGCTAEKYKQDADKEVQQILDSKWKPEHGTKANARIGDVKPDPNDLYYDPNYIPSNRLSLAEAVAIATARNRDYQKQKENLYLSALDLTLLRHNFAQKWFGAIDAGYDRTEADESISASGGNNGKAVGFSQLLADGTQVSTSIAADWLRYLTGDPRESLGSVLSASINKPLLRGADKEVVMENLTQGERTVLYQIRTFSRYRKTFVVSIISDYYRVLQDLDSVKNAESNYKSLMLAYDQAKDNALAGRLAKLEADQTEQRMLQARDNLAGSERSYQQALDNFKIRLAVTTNAPLELDPNALQALSVMEVVEPQFDIEDAIKTALSLRLDLATIKNQVDDARRKIKVSENALQADLNLVASASVDSTQPRQAGRLRFQDGSYSVGAQLDLPFDRKAERNSYRESLITLMQRQRDYENSIDNVKLDVRNNYRDLLEAAQRYQIQKKSLELAQERVNSTSMLFQAGRAQARDLLDSQDSLLSAQNSTTSTLVDYNIAKLSFYRDIEVLTVKPDGLWQIPENSTEKRL
ncbi:MAG: TolC family protein [Planctomycetes bacterium]|nr:TolC family protein [Planctomycetota bacterium]